MLPTLSITTLSILIIIVLNSQSDNSNIPAVCGSDACCLQTACVCLFLHLVIFFLITGYDTLSKRNCCKYAFSNVVRDEKMCSLVL